MKERCRTLPNVIARNGVTWQSGWGVPSVSQIASPPDKIGMARNDKRASKKVEDPLIKHSHRNRDEVP